MKVRPEKKDEVSINLLSGGMCFMHQGHVYMMLSRKVDIYEPRDGGGSHQLTSVNAVELESGKLYQLNGETVVKALPEATVRY